MDCAACKKEPKLKEEWFCDGGGDMRILDDTSMETSFDTCCLKSMSEDIESIMWLWREWRNGRQPEPGGSWDQPQGLIECFKILDGVVYLLEEEERNKCRN